MGQRRAHSQLCGRVWDMMNTEGGDCATYEIYKWYDSMWGMPCNQQTLGQVLLRSSMFRRVAWEYKGERRYDIGNLNAQDVYRFHGYSKSIVVAIWRRRPMTEIIEPYIEGKHTLRPLHNMPKFIRDAVKEASQ